MYKILGADQKEYGPVSAEQITQWIAEGRADANTVAQAEGSAEWKPLAQFPEFAQALQGRVAPAGTPAPLPPAAQTTPAPTLEQLTSRDYNLDIGGCISRGWQLLKDNFGLLFLTGLVYLLVQAGLSVFAQIPFVGILVSLASIIITGPLTAGLYSVYLRTARGQSAEVGGLFSGFSDRFGQYLLAYLVPAALTGLAAIPGLAMLIPGIILASKEHWVAAIPLILIGAIVLLIAVVYLSISWSFTILLTLDQRMDFWPAMQAGRKMVGKHFFAVLGLIIVIGLINLGGVLLCCVGVLVTMPLGFAAFVYAYETLFGNPQTEPLLR